MGKRGPKKKAVEDLRNHRFSVYVDELERAILVKRAGSDSKVPAYLRDAGLNRKLPKPPMPKADSEAWANLARLGNLLKSAMINYGDGRDLSYEIKQLKEAVEELKLELAK